MGVREGGGWAGRRWRRYDDDESGVVLAGEGVESPCGRVLCDALRVEFDDGECGMWCGDSGGAAVGGPRDECDADGDLEGEELERCLELVMGEGEKGREIRRNVELWRGRAREAVGEGGSSDRNLRDFVDEIAMHA